MENPFKWRHYRSEIILLCVHWYLRYAFSYRDLEEMMSDEAWRTIRGYEAVHMIRKDQVWGAEKRNIKAQNQFIAGLFGLAG